MHPKLSCLLIACAMVAFRAMAQQYTISAVVDSTVQVAHEFQLSYVVNTTAVSGFTLGQMPDGLEVVDGPARSTSVSTATVDGQLQTVSRLKLTYVLIASQPGTFVIPPATAKAGDQPLTSHPLTVTAVGIAPQQQAHTAVAPSGSDFFITAIPTKRRVTCYEPFLLTYKVCWDPDVTVVNLGPLTLQLADAYVLPYKDDQDRKRTQEVINGKRLVTVAWQQYVVYPLKPGRLHIPSMTMEGYYHEETPFDTYDPLALGYHELTRQLTAPSLTIQVDEPEGKPADFTGAVGRFTLAAKLSHSQVPKNTPVSLHVTVGGTGNFSMLRQPEVTFPNGFDAYDAKKTEHVQLTADGLSGSVTFEYVAVPQRMGTYTISPVRLTYYDLDSHTFQSLLTDSLHISVLPGGAATNAMTDYTGGQPSQGSDIRALRSGTTLPDASRSLFGSTAYFLILVGTVLLAGVLFLLLRYRFRRKADVVSALARRANRVAVKRLRKAEKLMKTNIYAPFYEETQHALWGYVADKLNIPADQLSRATVSQRLQAYGIVQSVATRFIEAIDECEYARFAPGDVQVSMEPLYNKAVAVIEELESGQRKTNKVS